jgi:hypothetical protein
MGQRSPANAAGMGGRECGLATTGDLSSWCHLVRDKNPAAAKSRCSRPFYSLSSAIARAPSTQPEAPERGPGTMKPGPGLSTVQKYLVEAFAGWCAPRSNTSRADGSEHQRQSQAQCALSSYTLNVSRNACAAGLAVLVRRARSGEWAGRLVVDLRRQRAARCRAGS